MRRLMETELFPIHVKNLQELSTVFNVKLAQDEGVIAPEHIAPEISKLRPKQSLFPLGAALTAYEQFNGKIKLFDLSVQSMEDLSFHHLFLSMLEMLEIVQMRIQKL